MTLTKRKKRRKKKISQHGSEDKEHHGMVSATTERTLENVGRSGRREETPGIGTKSVADDRSRNEMRGKGYLEKLGIGRRMRKWRNSAGDIPDVKEKKEVKMVREHAKRKKQQQRDDTKHIEREQRDRDTLKLANECLAKNNLTQLRKLAAVRGLVNHGLRKRVWPRILGTRTSEVVGNGTKYKNQSQLSHKDDSVVRADMDRSLWKYTVGWSVDAREKERQALSRIVNATIEGNKDDVYYYQGLHDVASVLLFVCGEGAAHGILRHLTRCHLRDCTRVTIQPALTSLKLLYKIIAKADEELYSFLMSLNEPSLETPYFALSWYMTWFSHDIDSLDQCARLFDLFIASHPLLPLYVAAAVVMNARDEIMQFSPTEGDMVYSFLKSIRVCSNGFDADMLAQQATGLYKSIPPASLLTGKLKRELMTETTTPFAEMQNEKWVVAHTPAVIRSHALPTASMPGIVAQKAQTVFFGVLVTGLAGLALLLQSQQQYPR